MRNIADAFARYERALISTRTKALLAVTKSWQERTGQVPYGWRGGPAGKLQAEPAEQDVL